MKIRILFIPALVYLWMLAGCAQAPILMPSPSLNVTGGTVAKEVKGVSVTVSGDAWKGEKQIREHVTPVKITIKNNHGTLLKVTYSFFSLTDDSGNLYAALPPYSVQGSISETAKSPFYCPGFYVPPYYSPFYPRLPGYYDPFYYDPFYYQYYYPCLQKVNLPTKEMLDVALPEGVLKNGAEITGFLYFQKIGKAEDYTFAMDLVDAKTGERFGTIRIPFIKKK